MDPLRETVSRYLIEAIKQMYTRVRVLGGRGIREAVDHVGSSHLPILAQLPIPGRVETPVGDRGRRPSTRRLGSSTRRTSLGAILPSLHLGQLRLEI